MSATSDQRNLLGVSSETNERKLITTANLTGRYSVFIKKLEKSRLLAPLWSIRNSFRKWSLIQRFTLTSAVIMLSGMAGIGWWVGDQIEANVIKEATAQTALYMDSFVTPNIQELNTSESISPEHIDALNDLFTNQSLGAPIVSVKIWSKDKRIIYSNIPDLVGRTFTDVADQETAWNGIATGDITELEKDENVDERLLSTDPLFEIYTPIYLIGTHQIIAVAESYQKADVLHKEIRAAQRWGWLMVGGCMSVIYFVLIGFVYWVSNRIDQQRMELKKQVAELTRLLIHNKELTRRVRSAAANTIALNEGLFRRISADLHDGPMQEIGMALYRRDFAIKEREAGRSADPSSSHSMMTPISLSYLQTALQELRTIAARLGIPQFDDFSLPDVILLVVELHEQKTGTSVSVNIKEIPDQADLPTKITCYRFIQEGLNNAHRHAAGAGQSVLVTYKSRHLNIEISDQGPGFDASQSFADHLGLAGIQKHVESLGGNFAVRSKIGQGTKLIVQLPMQDIVEDRIKNGYDSHDNRG